MTTTETIHLINDDNETMAILINGDEIRQIFTTDGIVVDDSTVYAGSDVDGWLHEHLIDYRADGWTEYEPLTAEYSDEGRIYVDGTEVGAYDADGGEWADPVKTLLRQYGWSPVDDWQTGEHAYDPATIRVRDIR